MDQADSLRELFAKDSARKELIRCLDKVREAIRSGNQNDIKRLISELEQAQILFEQSNFIESVGDTS